MKATKVNLRAKELLNGRKSLFLDFYPPILNTFTGQETRREFLNLHILSKPKTSLEKQVHKETMILAESIRARRQLAIQEGDFGFFKPKKEIKESIDFLKFYLDMSDNKNESNRGNWLSAYKHLKKFCSGNLDASQINETFITDFKNFLLNDTHLAHNTKWIYFDKFIEAVKEGEKKGIIASLPTVKRIKLKETRREFLSLEEIELLINTDCEKPIIKNAALFSAFTGLRFCDIINLKWSQLEYFESTGYILKFSQQKTGGIETMILPKLAIPLMGTRKEEHVQVFSSFVYSSENNAILRAWIFSSGIKKRITFHCFRHTFATLQLSNGTDIYTVSKLLGHKDLKTTQLYAKVVDKKKTDAANLMDSLF